MQLPQNEVWQETPGANLRIQVSHIHVLLTSLGQHVPLKINVGFAKVWRKKTFFLAKMAFSTWKNLEQPSYILYLQLHIYIISCFFQYFVLFDYRTLQQKDANSYRSTFQFTEGHRLSRACFAAWKGGRAWSCLEVWGCAKLKGG